MWDREEVLTNCAVNSEQASLRVLVFVSTFHSGRVSIPNWRMPSLDVFAKYLTQEQDKLIQMGVLQTSKNGTLRWRL